ncbi:MAG: L-aspartate oxidase [bacterium]
MTECIETEVLIIGCGIAGGTAALRLADAGIPVTVVTRAQSPHESNTFYAQGGIIYRARADSPDLLKDDLLKAGAGLTNPASADILATDGPGLVEEILINRLRVRFDRTEGGELSLTREGSHSLARIIHAADATGAAIEDGLLQALTRHENVTLLDGLTAIDLLTPAHHSVNRLAIYEPTCCVGTYFLRQQKGTVIRCLAKKTILATGGLGQIFLRTTNPAGARGDGLAMAHRAGGRVINCEFVQFHPTAFYHRNAASFLISEAVRGEGARLVHADGKPFMQKYDAEWKDLAPRDVVARSIHQEMLAKGVPNVYLDVRSYLTTEHIREHFPTISEQCLAHGVDMTRDLVPVVPAAHYSCGGIWVDEWSRTTLHHLYAVGEVACTGVHGANRLASASLLEGLVWGARAAKHIESTLAKQQKPNLADIPPWQDTGKYAPDVALIRQDMSSIKHIMWNYVGLVRNKHRLSRAHHDLRNLELEIERFYGAANLTDELIGLRNAVRVAVLVTAAAWQNKMSMGCHYRVD